jgi:hypothetical protein
VIAAAVAAATMALAATPSEAQAPPPAPPAPPPRHNHPPARVTIHKRPSVDPVTVERRRRDEYYGLFSPEYGMSPMRDSTLFMNGPSLPFWHDRMPFPTCLDLPGYCIGP